MRDERDEEGRDEEQEPDRCLEAKAHQRIRPAAPALCPWHEAVLREDTGDELFKATVDQV